MEENEEARPRQAAMEAIPQGGEKDEADGAERWQEEAESVGKV